MLTEPNLRWKMRVQLTNAVGLDEAGVDGGGIFREFLSELLKTSFDPNRGFFRLTHDNLLYPNPGVAVLVSDFPAHYYFIGRMLGKVGLNTAFLLLSDICDVMIIIRHCMRIYWWSYQWRISSSPRSSVRPVLVWTSIIWLP
jgi:hypothetical protein